MWEFISLSVAQNRAHISDTPDVSVHNSVKHAYFCDLHSSHLYPDVTNNQDGVKYQPHGAKGEGPLD